MNTKHLTRDTLLGLFVVLAGGWPARASAQEGAEAIDELLGDVEQIEDVALEDLLTMETDVASSGATAVRESPGIITVITREEIRNMGARDLIDVLRQVPGIYFGSDVQGAVGLGFRGHWGHEGKILLIIDGQEANELLYSTLQFGNHYPVEHIERIEIVRGPGSVTYGGLAELAVIRITTRSGADLRGGEASVTYGQMWSSDFEDYGRRNVSLQVGHELGERAAFSLGAFVGQGRRGDDVYEDFYGNSYRISVNRHDPMMLNVGLSFDDVSARLILDNYRTAARDGFDESLPAPVDTDFQSILAGVKVRMPAGDLTVTPSFDFAQFSSWRVEDTSIGGVDLEDIAMSYERVVRRYRGRLLGDYELSDDVVARVGLEAYADHTPPVPPPTDSGHRAYANVAALADVSWRNPIVNMTLGARAENHSKFGESIVPRVGLTRVFGDFHLKGLFAIAFRAPGIENIDLNPDVQPERTFAFEVEAGYRLGDDMSLTVNAYDVTVRRPIIYFYDEDADTEAYLNFDRVGTRGVDLEYRLNAQWGYVNLSYSVYSAGSLLADRDETPELYAVEGAGARLLGAPRHKIGLHGALLAIEKLRIGPSVVFTSSRSGYTDVDADDTQLIGETDPMVLLNLFVSYDFEALGVPGLRVGAGVFNILDADDVFVQPYDGYRPPLPGPDRELVARISYGHELD
jgi:outer membrane receptor protein involved in Fe transport